MEQRTETSSNIHRVALTTGSSDSINMAASSFKSSQNEVETPEILNTCTDKSFQYEIISNKNMSDIRTPTKLENNKLVKFTKVVLDNEEMKKDPVFRVVTPSYGKGSEGRKDLDERDQEEKVGVATDAICEEEENRRSHGMDVTMTGENVGVATNVIYGKDKNRLSCGMEVHRSGENMGVVTDATCEEEENRQKQGMDVTRNVGVASYATCEVDENRQSRGKDVTMSKENVDMAKDALCEDDENTDNQNQRTEVTMYLDISCDTVSEDDSQSDSTKCYFNEDEQRIDSRNNFKMAKTSMNEEIKNMKNMKTTPSPIKKEEDGISAADVKSRPKPYKNKKGRFAKQRKYSEKQQKYFFRSKDNQSLKTQNNPTENGDHQYTQSEERSGQETNSPKPIENFSSKRKRKYGDSVKCKFCNYYHLKNSCLLFVLKNLKEDRSTCANSEILSLISLPRQLTLKFTSESHGISVYASELIRVGTQFGPVLGIPLEFKDLTPIMDFTHVWISTCEDGNDAEYLSTKDEMQSNWCRYLRSSFYLEECNTVSFVHNKQVFFTTRRDIPPGEELVIYHLYYEQLSATSVYAKLFADGETNRYCIRCKHQFDSWANYATHIKIFHPKGSMMMKNECKECGLILFSNNELTKHCKIEHEGRGAFICQEENCGRHFTNFERLKYHQKLQHFPEGNYKCELCDKVFPNPLKRKNHVRWVHSQSVFKCNICDKQFKRRECLFRHEKIHGTNFKFCCDRCGKQCRDRTNLKVHLLTHSKIKPFQCQEIECTAGFTTKQCLQNHYKKSHNYTDENLPEIIRSVPFTEEAHGKPNELEQFENLLQSVPLTLEAHETL